jgi:hypothetical protein
MKMQVINVRVSNALMDNLKILAATRHETLAEAMRRILEQGASTEIFTQGMETITTAIRKTIRAELKSTENRIPALAAKAGIAAGTAEQMVAVIVERANSTPGMTTEEKKRQAIFLHQRPERKQ